MFLLIFFTSFLLQSQLGIGMRGSGDPYGASSSGPASSPDEPIADPSNFSLVELTVLIRTLLEIKQDDLIERDNVDKEMIIIFKEKVENVIGRFNLSGDDLANEGVNKFEELILYYNSMMNQRDEYKIIYINNHYYEDEIIELIEKRLKDFNFTMGEQRYMNFLEKCDINDKEDLIHLRKHEQNLFNCLLQYSARTFKVERNLFILWNLYTFTRKLIRSFLAFHADDSHYNNELNEYYTKNQRPMFVF
uniref:Uncharacterized protein n=1 Tax=Meloidogyne hapla TaxID=6305 RepID=A0A1I8BCL5_MELHA